MCNILTVEEMEMSGEYDDYSSLARDFARFHVTAALKAAAENVEIIKDCGRKDNNKCNAVFCRNCSDIVDKESILNSYPLTNIQ